MPYQVYVVELSDGAGPRRNPDKPCVYVGQSYHPPDVRLSQHRDGVRASRWVRRYAVGLLPELSAGYGPYETREEAEIGEALCAARLESQGFTVRGGH